MSGGTFTTVFCSQHLSQPTWLGLLHRLWIQSFLKTDRDILIVIPGAKKDFEFEGKEWEGLEVIRPPLNMTSAPQLFMAFDKKKLGSFHFMDPVPSFSMLLFQTAAITLGQIKRFAVTQTFLSSPKGSSKWQSKGMDALFYSHPQIATRFDQQKITHRKKFLTALPLPEVEIKKSTKKTVLVPGPFENFDAATNACANLSYDSHFDDANFVFCHGFSGLTLKDKKKLFDSPLFKKIRARTHICEEQSPARDLEWLSQCHEVELRHIPEDHLHHQVFSQIQKGLDPDLFGNSMKRWYSELEWQKRNSPTVSTSA